MPNTPAWRILKVRKVSHVGGSVKRLTTVGLQILLSLAFLASAILKLAGAADAMREHLEIAQWFWVLTALVEIVGAAGMLVGIPFPRLAAPAGLWIAALMGGALVAHLRVGDSFMSMVPATVYLVLALAVAALHAGAYGFREARDAVRTGGRK
jgi:putative oxidoreductase